MPRLIRYALDPMSNSISTTHCFLLMLLVICVFEMFRNGLLNSAKQIASNMVLFPLPFFPTINVVGSAFRMISVGVFPVERKFLKDTFLNEIIPQSPVLQ